MIPKYTDTDQDFDWIHPYYFSYSKRVFDVLVSLTVLIVGSPIWLVIGLVQLTLIGFPLFYSQERAGLQRRPFKIYKVRTMYVGADKDKEKFESLNVAPGPMFKIFNDPRFVGIGAWLSRTGIDELPQLVNVLQGEMSLVGPRPLPVAEAQKLTRQRPDWVWRWRVKPGIFSEWSASERRHSTLKEWQHLEKLTLQKGGFIFEQTIIAKTIYVHLFG